MKKIIFYNGSLRMGGIERIMIEVLKAIDKTKYEIELLIEDGIRSENVFENDIPDEIKLTYLKDEETILNTRRLREKKSNIFYKLAYNLAMRRERKIKRDNFLKYIKDNKPDIIIDFDMGLSKVMHLVESDIKRIAWVHASIKKWYEKPDKIKRLGERLKSYDRIIAICDDMKDELNELYPELADKTYRIYNPFDFNRINLMAADFSKLDDFQKDVVKNEKYFVSVMRLTTKQKDFKTLFNAFKKLKEKGIEEKLVILGGGPDKEEIEKMVSDLKLQEDVLLLGSVDNPYPFIKSASLFLHSSKYEGLPTVLIEAMILGKMIVSTDCPTGPREILDNGRCGILTEIEDVESLVKGIEEALKNKEMYLEKASVRVQEFSKEKVMKEYEKNIDAFIK